MTVPRDLPATLLDSRSRSGLFRVHLVGLVISTLGLSSCAHFHDEMAGDPFLNRFETQVAANSEPSDKNSTPPSPTTGSAKLVEGISLPLNAETGRVEANPRHVLQVQRETTLDSGEALPTATNEELNAPPGEHSIVCPPEAISPEWCPLPGMGSYGALGHFPPVTPAWIGGAAILPNPRSFPDEYLCDGGDRGYPVRYDGLQRLGLETEDTVAEYTDHTGDTHVKPSNRVCVYAPRFGAMRSISAPVAGTAVDKLASADKFFSGVGLNNRDAPGIHKQHLGAGKFHVRSRASGIDVESLPANVLQNTAIASHTRLVNTYQDLQFVRTGQLVQTDEARLASGIQAAAIWTRTQFPIIAAQTDEAHEVVGEFRPQEVVGKEDRREPGRLRIVKLADKETALPGDVITFTLRYDNLGERELYEIRILDNLTPRLQYVEDSETSDRAGRLVLEDNQEGSLLLQFVLDEPLPAGQGGLITFQAKVR